MTHAADRALADDFAQTADAIFALLAAASVSENPDEIWHLRQAARSQLAVCEALSRHVRRVLAGPVDADAARPGALLRCEQA